MIIRSLGRITPVSLAGTISSNSAAKWNGEVASITYSFRRTGHYRCIFNFHLHHSTLANVWSRLKLFSYSLRKNILHWVRRMQAIQPEILIYGNTTRRVEVIFSWSATVVSLATRSGISAGETYLAYASQYAVVFL